VSETSSIIPPSQPTLLSPLWVTGSHVSAAENPRTRSRNRLGPKGQVRFGGVLCQGLKKTDFSVFQQQYPPFCRCVSHQVPGGVPFRSLAILAGSGRGRIHQLVNVDVCLYEIPHLASKWPRGAVCASGVSQNELKDRKPSHAQRPFSVPDRGPGRSR
jgi:hypothetical protein